MNQENFSCICQTPPTSLRIILDEEQNRERILQKVVSRILYYYHEAKNGNRIEVENKYKTKLFSTGKFQEKGVVFEATITDVEPDGTLVLKDSSGKIRRYLFKEVEFLIT